MKTKFKKGETTNNHEHYNIFYNIEEKMVFFEWKQIPDLSIEDFKQGIIHFAKNCKTVQPKKIVFDARMLNPDGAPFGWVTGQKNFEGQEDYNSWWFRDIVPIYHQSKVEKLYVATGDPNAPGIIDPIPGVNFEIGYFADLDVLT